MIKNYFLGKIKTYEDKDFFYHMHVETNDVKFYFILILSFDKL